MIEPFFLTESLGKELNSFIDHPEDWIERVIIVTSDKKEEETQINKIKVTLEEYLAKFIRTMKIPELSFYIPKNQL